MNSRTKTISSSCFKIAILGNASVGKTSIIKRYVRQSFDTNYKATIGVDFLVKEIQINNENIALQIWDTVGTEKFHSISVSYLRGCDAGILVYSVDDKESFASLENWKNILKQLVEAAPIFIFANKCELDQEIDKGEAQQWADSNHFDFYETSAKDGDGIEAAFEAIAKIIYDKSKSVNIESTSRQLENIIIDEPVEQPKTPEKKGCC
eukprot:TRINITY_DN2050_c0_g1_i1.p1 TRINITY_DN2050_c0_g1~~TRINITY_DN2050_c0_g1_i1.p1  ORF type:complete len:208 (+),score=65.86 TRINITY_DN2050_c0_g1_i1:57-680(+)